MLVDYNPNRYIKLHRSGMLTYRSYGALKKFYKYFLLIYRLSEAVKLKLL